MRVLFHGAGVETRAAALAFRARMDCELAVFGADGEGMEGARHLSIEEARSYLSGALYLRSPGVPPRDGLYQEARLRAAFVSTPTGLWLRDEAPEGAITVTGTKGKSTTTALLASCLRAGGGTSAAYGNIGRPPLSVPPPQEDHPVVELSSYMMHDLPEAEHLHVVTNLFEDHLDWHGGKLAYHEAKLRPFRRKNPARGLAPRALIAVHDLPPSVRAIEEIVPGELEVGGLKIDPGPEERGFHAGPLRLALQAATAACAVTLGSEGAAEAASEAAASFGGLPSRQCIVPSTDGRLWVDDALATIPEAVLSALDRFAPRRIAVILGGADRGIDYRLLADGLAVRENVTSIAFGPVATRLAFADHQAEDFEQAIGVAERITPLGGAILFSPAAPSSPPHGSYLERSAVFADAAGRAG